MSKEVWCDTGSSDHPLHLIARDEEWDDAESLASESGAFHHGGDTGSGDWFCAEYVQAQCADGAYLAQEYERERAARRAMEDHEEYLDSILSRADDICDRMREEGR